MKSDKSLVLQYLSSVLFRALRTRQILGGHQRTVRFLLLGLDKGIDFLAALMINSVKQFQSCCMFMKVDNCVSVVKLQKCSQSASFGIYLGSAVERCGTIESKEMKMGKWCGQSLRSVDHEFSRPDIRKNDTLMLCEKIKFRQRFDFRF